MSFARHTRVTINPFHKETLVDCYCANVVSKLYYRHRRRCSSVDRIRLCAETTASSARRHNVSRRPVSVLRRLLSAARPERLPQYVSDRCRVRRPSSSKPLLPRTRRSQIENKSKYAVGVGSVFVRVTWCSY